MVGPNGCGKSNIMDAVRWVLGESKASELRGESMQDVIFNGTDHRKPASRASVELVFDNSDRARRRPVEPVRRDRRQARAHARRHQQLLHQQPAGAPPRRAGRVPGHRPGPARLRHHRPGHDQPHHRDRKPEELRLFLEEAAGVSKYKERRRETENRLTDTRENLTRVDDILRELNANLDKLEKQAEVAQQLPRAAGPAARSSCTSCGS
ncbi:MAG: AAA family ATPase [Comamonadaceae bacterium]|nr:AAA family ATPase [Comamonadaceae bacterium]